MVPSETVAQGKVASETFAFSGGKVSVTAALTAQGLGLTGSLTLSEDVGVLVDDLKAACEKASAANPSVVAIEETVFDTLKVLLAAVK